ncbi:MAG: hypothetical protein ACRDJC_22690 [Thermomicrobiales bacterium]
MKPKLRSSLPRRNLLAAGAGALALAVPKAQGVATRTILQRGMSGGGLAQLEGSEETRLANFGLFASSMQLPEGTTLVLGAIQWIEAGTDFQLQSIEVTQCIPLADSADGAEVRGRMQVNGEGDYPFLIRAFDSGRPGSALDRIEIEVNTDAAREGASGEASDDAFSYQAAGNLVAGDFQWVIADIAVDEV